MYTEIKLPILPSHIVNYIGSCFIAVYDKKNSNECFIALFKAFNVIENEENEWLIEYKQNIQKNMANKIVNEKCNEFADIIIGDYDFSATEKVDVVQTIRNNNIYDYNTAINEKMFEEFLDITYLIENLKDYKTMEYLMEGMPQGPINIRSLPKIKLLEQGIITNSEAICEFVKDHLLCSPAMLVYIYMKYNHYRYRPIKTTEKEIDNVNDWILKMIGLCYYENNTMNTMKETLKIILCLAIGGTMLKTVYNNKSEETNQVVPNFEMVKKIVPRYIKSTEVLRIQQNENDDEDENDEEQTYYEPYGYWEKYNTLLYKFNENNFEFDKYKIEKNKEIGEYLSR